MAMDKDILGSAINSAIDELSLTGSGSDGAITESDVAAHKLEVWKTVADELIKHLQENMEIGGSSGVFNVNSDGGNFT